MTPGETGDGVFHRACVICGEPMPGEELPKLWLSNRLQVARDLFGHGYLSLSQAQKTMVDQTVFATLAADYNLIIFNS
jgi:hypothetical protein